MEKVDKLLETARVNIYASHEQGRMALKEAYVLALEEDYLSGQAWALMRMGSYELSEGKRYKAIDYYKKSLLMMKSLKDNQGISRCHYSMGTVYAMLADFDLALTHFIKAKDLSLKYDSEYYSKLINNIAETYLQLNQYTSAIRMANHVIDYKLKHHENRLFTPYATLGNAYLGIGRYRDALQCAEKSLTYLEEKNDAGSRSVANLIVAGAYKGLKYYDEALIVYNRALKLGSGAGDFQNASEINRHIAEIYFVRKEYDYTFRHLQEAMVMSLKHRSKKDEADAYFLYAKVYESLENYKKAFDYYKKGVEIQQVIYSDKIHAKYQNEDLTDLESDMDYSYGELYLDKTLSELRTTYLNLSISEKSQLTDAFVEAIVDTIDMRDTTTSGHSKRIARYCLEMMRQLNENQDAFEHVTFSDSEMKEMYYAALLHDIGKLAIRESILLKHQRLTEDRLEAIYHKKVYIKSYLKMKSNKEELTDNEMTLLMNIEDYMVLIRQSNLKKEMDEQTIKTLTDIHNLMIMNDREESLSLIDAFELEHLIVKKGNLVKDEWEQVKTHAEKTKEVLEIIPWMKGIQNVPYLASSHHEKIDGSGYPLGLKGDEVSIPMRILSIVDIFEALTASDRPYKTPLSIESALDVLIAEAGLGKLDSELIDFFIKKGICYLCKDEIESKS